MKTDRFAANGFLPGMNVNKAVAVCLAAAIICLLLSACASNKAIVPDRESTAVSADGSRIAHGVSGQGETTLLFVHGWLCDHKTWQAQIDYFPTDYKVVWLDLAGHGRSGANRRNFTMSAFAQDVKSVVDKTGGEKLILVGHSMGGPIAIETAKLLGERVTGIVGVEAFYTPLAAVPEEAKLAFIETLKKDYPKALAGTVKSMFAENADQDLIDSIYKDMLDNDYEVGVSSLYECIKWNSQKEPLELKRFSSKLYNINGAPKGNEKKLHESVVLIPGAGHFAHQVEPKEFNAALETIIENFKTH